MPMFYNTTGQDKGKHESYTGNLVSSSQAPACGGVVSNTIFLT